MVAPEDVERYDVSVPNPKFDPLPSSQPALGFDPRGRWTVSGTVPSALSGNVVTFQSFGIAPTGKVRVTNLETVTF